MRLQIITYKADNANIAIRTNFLHTQTITDLLKANYDEVEYVQTYTPQEYKNLIDSGRLRTPDHFISTTSQIWMGIR